MTSIKSFFILKFSLSYNFLTPISYSICSFVSYLCTGIIIDDYTVLQNEDFFNPNKYISYKIKINTPIYDQIFYQSLYETNTNTYLNKFHNAPLYQMQFNKYNQRHGYINPISTLPTYDLDLFNLYQRKEKFDFLFLRSYHTFFLKYSYMDPRNSSFLDYRKDAFLSTKGIHFSNSLFYSRDLPLSNPSNDPFLD